MENKIIENKSMRYQKKTILKLPLKSSVTVAGEYPIPRVVLTPSTRNNSVVPDHGEEDLCHLVLPPAHGLHCGDGPEDRKVSVMSLLSFMANGSNRPSIFSQYRLHQFSIEFNFLPSIMIVREASAH